MKSRSVPATFAAATTFLTALVAASAAIAQPVPNPPVPGGNPPGVPAGGSPTTTTGAPNTIAGTTTTVTTTPGPTTPDPNAQPTQPTEPVPPTPPQPPTTPPAPVAPAQPPAVAPTPPVVRDFLDTRLTWTFGDDDILTATGQRVPVSPLPRISDRSQYQLFFDALNSRYAGRENLTHLALYARAPGFIPNIQTEAALVLRVDLAQLTSGAGNLERSFYDAGTYLRLLYQTNPSRPADGFSLTFFPFDTDRFRLGYLWDLSWGGNDVFPRRVGGAPGLRIGFDSGPLSLYAGFKTAAIVIPLSVVTSSADIEVVRVEETQYAGLAGLGYRFGDFARLDVSGGFFQQGRFDFPGVRGEPVFVFGGSTRLVFNHNLTPPTSIDMQLYRNHPDFPMQVFAPERYTPGAFSWLLSVEGTALGQNLSDINTPGRQVIQPAFAGAVQGRARYDYLSIGLTGLLRDVPFLLRNVPSFIPFQSIPADATVAPELFFALSVDYRIQRANLLPQLVAGLQFPATFSTTTTEGSLQAQRTLVIRRAGNFSILPPGQGSVPIFSARASLRWDISSILAGLVWVQYVLDNNATLLQVDTSGTREVRIFQAPSQLGFGMTMQARF